MVVVMTFGIQMFVVMTFSIEIFCSGDIRNSNVRQMTFGI